MASEPVRRRLAAAALLIAAATLAGVAWDKAVKDHLFPKRFSEVTPDQIYRSGRLTPGATRRVVEAHDIRTEVDLGGWDQGSVDERRAALTADELGITRHTLRLYGDATGDPNRYVDALRIMTDPASQPVLVHCAAGTERTGALVAFYRHIIEGVDLEQALAEADARGHDPRDNPRLRQYVERWVDEIETSYRNGAPIPWPHESPQPQADSPGSANNETPEPAIDAASGSGG